MRGHAKYQGSICVIQVKQRIMDRGLKSERPKTAERIPLRAEQFEYGRDIM